MRRARIVAPVAVAAVLFIAVIVAGQALARPNQAAAALGPG
ncbi:MAG: hypothetical protein QOG30_3276, partial [Acidimicrobiaceae bacterium]